MESKTLKLVTENKTISLLLTKFQKYEPAVLMLESYLISLKPDDIAFDFDTKQEIYDRVMDILETNFSEKLQDNMYVFNADDNDDNIKGLLDFDSYLKDEIYVNTNFDLWEYAKYYDYKYTYSEEYVDIYRKEKDFEEHKSHQELIDLNHHEEKEIIEFVEHTPNLSSKSLLKTLPEFDLENSESNIAPVDRINAMFERLFNNIHYSFEKYLKQIVIAGEFAFKLYTGITRFNRQGIDKVDLFIHSRTKKEVSNFIENFISTLGNFVTGLHKENGCLHITTQKNVEFIFHLQCFSSLNEIINSFDIDCCSIAYSFTKGHFYCNDRFKYSISHKVNTVNFQLMTDDIEDRLVKFLALGIGIDMPCYDKFVENFTFDTTKDIFFGTYAIMKAIVLNFMKQKLGYKENNAKSNSAKQILDLYNNPMRRINNSIENYERQQTFFTENPDNWFIESSDILLDDYSKEVKTVSIEQLKENMNYNPVKNIWGTELTDETSFQYDDFFWSKKHLIGNVYTNYMSMFNSRVGISGDIINFLIDDDFRLENMKLVFVISDLSNYTQDILNIVDSFAKNMILNISKVIFGKSLDEEFYDEEPVIDEIIDIENIYRQFNVLSIIPSEYRSTILSGEILKRDLGIDVLIPSAFIQILEEKERELYGLIRTENDYEKIKILIDSHNIIELYKNYFKYLAPKKIVIKTLWDKSLDEFLNDKSQRVPPAFLTKNGENTEIQVSELGYEMLINKITANNSGKDIKSRIIGKFKSKSKNNRYELMNREIYEEIKHKIGI